jgi:hypothetical protein
VATYLTRLTIERSREMANKKGKGIAIIISMMDGKKGKKMKKPEMMYGGSVGGKKHMYSGGGSVTDNAGLSALKQASPEAYMNIKKNA